MLKMETKYNSLTQMSVEGATIKAVLRIPWPKYLVKMGIIKQKICPWPKCLKKEAGVPLAPILGESLNTIPPYKPTNQPSASRNTQAVNCQSN